MVWLAFAGVGGSGLVFAGILALAVAVLGASFTGCEATGEAATSTAAEAPSAYALQSIPPERLRLYEQAGERFDIDWSFLASIGAQECGNGECAGVNGSGCAGPMQIAYLRESPCSPGPGPTLWERYAVDADPSRPLSVNDPADAIYTAARILRQDMGAPPSGGSYAQYRQAACNYYGACADDRRLRRRGHGPGRAVRVHRRRRARPDQPAARRTRQHRAGAVQRERARTRSRQRLRDR